MVVWTDTAIKDLTNFIDNAKKDTEKTAKKYINNLIEYVNILDSMHDLGIELTLNFNELPIKQLIYKSHKIIYYVKNDNVYILTVFHSKMDFKSALQRLIDNK